ncbi:hypothetical protein Ae201684P_004626 [Aphanomyces euteiches]|nr:hypothetical protein Ae201684P_004626 [Aphanomyces euteiches]
MNPGSSSDTFSDTTLPGDKFHRSTTTIEDQLVATSSLVYVDQDDQRVGPLVMTNPSLQHGGAIAPQNQSIPSLTQVNDGSQHYLQQSIHHHYSAPFPALARDMQILKRDSKEAVMIREGSALEMQVQQSTAALAEIQRKLSESEAERQHNRLMQEQVEAEARLLRDRIAQMEAASRMSQQEQVQLQNVIQSMVDSSRVDQTYHPNHEATGNTAGYTTLALRLQR